MAYSDKVVDHFENPRNAGALDARDVHVGTGAAGGPGLGLIRLQIQVDAATGGIVAARFKAHGGVAAIASASLLTEWLQGRTLAEAAQLKSGQLARELALEPMRVHSSILAWDALQAAINDYKAKRGAATEVA